MWPKGRLFSWGKLGWPQWGPGLSLSSSAHIQSLPRMCQAIHILGKASCEHKVDQCNKSQKPWFSSSCEACPFEGN